MYLKNELENLGNTNIDFYVDMDGVIADYKFIDGIRYDNKRPLYDSIKKLEQINNMPNVKLHVLSVSRGNIGIEQKNNWLDKYAPFFEKKNRNLLSREANNMKAAMELKTEFMENCVKNKDENTTIVFIDDDPAIFKAIDKKFPEVIMLKDCALVD